jgi:hypothetical protein
MHGIALSPETLSLRGSTGSVRMAACQATLFRSSRQPSDGLSKFFEGMKP